MTIENTPAPDSMPECIWATHPPANYWYRSEKNIKKRDADKNRVKYIRADHHTALEHYADEWKRKHDELDTAYVHVKSQLVNLQTVARQMAEALSKVNKIVAKGSVDGLDPLKDDFGMKLYRSQADTHKALAAYEKLMEGK